jgi:FimV-like protein
MKHKWIVCCSMMLVLLTAQLAHANSVYYGPTTKQDHFWQMVDKFRSNNSISREQMAVAILQANPAAFSDGNVNALRNGQMLRIPTTDEVRQTNAQTAFKTVEQMNQTWQADHPPLPPNPVGNSSNDDFKTIVRVTPEAPPSNVHKLESFGNNDSWGYASRGLTNNRLENSELQQQLHDTQQELRQLEQQVNLQVGKLVQQNLLMQAQLENNNQVLEWALEQMQKNNVGGQRLTPPAIFNGKSLQLVGQPLPANQRNSTKLLLGIIVVVLLVLLGIWLPWQQKNTTDLRAELRVNEPKPPRPVADVAQSVHAVTKHNAQAPIGQENQEESGEYDFLNGQEGMIAKLNIARVYLDMEDFSTAKKYLAEVMTYGTQEQRHEAEQLQQKIQAATRLSQGYA